MSSSPITRYTKLQSGLRVVTTHWPGLAEYCGVTVNVGSRDELVPSDHGLAHFVEHTIFKGTRHRRAWHILNRMEAVGGELNAYTTKEETVVYTVFPSGALARAMDLVADIVIDSVFPAVEVERERSVVEDEIVSYLDQPSERIFDDFEQLIYGASPLAHNILGSEQTVGRFMAGDCMRWLEQHYTSGQMVLFYCGRQDHDKVVKMAERLFGRMVRRECLRQRCTPAVAEPFRVVREIGSHQSHTVMGSRTNGLMHDDRFALALLTNIIGGPGMNSLLNVNLRERRGLVYNIEASTALLSDTGLMSIYFGCDREDTDRCRHQVIRTLETMASKPLSEASLKASKRQFLGQLLIQSTSQEHTALSAGRNVLYHGRVMTADEVGEQIKAINPEQLMAMAQSLLPLSELTLC